MYYVIIPCNICTILHNYFLLKIDNIIYSLIKKMIKLIQIGRGECVLISPAYIAGN